MSTERENESDPPTKRGKFPVMLVVFLAGTLAGMVVCGGLGTAVVALQIERARAAEGAAHQAEMQARSEVEAKEQALKAEREAAVRTLEFARKGNRVLGEVFDGMAQFKEPQPRSLFVTLVNGATEERLTTMFGKPDATEVRDGETCWVYVGRTKVADVTFE